MKNVLPPSSGSKSDPSKKQAQQAVHRKLDSDRDFEMDTERSNRLISTLEMGQYVLSKRR
jgi:hypothetical protein